MDDPQQWQCTDKAALKEIAKNRSCLAYDNSNGYTFLNGECIPSDYNGCIDTYNKFMDLKTCTQGKLLCLLQKCVSVLSFSGAFLEVHTKDPQIQIFQYLIT